MGGGRNAEHADVVEDVPTDDLRRDPIVVRELDEDAVRGVNRGGALAGIRDHMRIREDRPGA